jgi:hypothetical protein
MKTTPLSFVATTATLMAAAVCQNPTFRMDPAVALGAGGATITYDLTANSGTLYSVLANIDGGPVDYLGERFYLGLTPTLVTLQAGLVSPSGVAAGTLQIPQVPGALGLTVFGQGAIIDSTAPNGLFVATNAESSITYATSFAMVLDFDDPTGLGFTGSYSTHIPGHIAGGAVTTRTYETVDPQGVPFPQPLQNPLNPNGCREQMVFRTQDVGATGSPELVTAIRWYSATPIANDRFSQFEVLMGHTAVVPDYTIGSFTGLPIAPNSGLAATFVSNYVTGAAPVTVFQGAYDLVPALQLANGYMPIPVVAPFRYDGVSSLLVEFKTHVDAQALGVNGMYGNLMVQSMALPAARNTAGGSPGVFFNPAVVPTGTGDNWMANLQLEFARVETEALSPWLAAGISTPDYDAANVAASLPSGTSVRYEYRGTVVPGATPTAWASTPNVADGLSFLQVRMTFFGNHVTGEVPVVDTLIVPFN